MREIDREWTVEESLQAMEDLDYMARDGQWHGSRPEWASRFAKEMHCTVASSNVLMLAYEKSAKAFRKKLIEDWRLDRDYIPCPGDRPLEET